MGYYLKFILIISIQILFIKPANSENNVKSLIGTKIPSSGISSTGRIQNFHSVSGGIINHIYEHKNEYTLAMDEGIYNKRYPALIITKIFKDYSSEITDAMMLPEQIIEYKFSEGHVVYKKNKYRLTSICQLSGYDAHANDEVVFALVKPEKGKFDCGHYSKNISNLWLVNNEGKIKNGPKKGAQCFYLTLNDCY